ncbi:alpha-amylase/pullulanase [Anoxybacillus flavithermus]|uniref:Alpha-amylase/pullulanase n=1 Tax=Anoxybacillus flavithermus TaxID=33934 RepID=A0A2G5RPQ6_9BACL|nr:MULTISPECIES: carboxypeptidase regulatory-like domain-containing protein [Anoxybacillus]KFZ43731.1 alpha-amylase/pullulanase [Anoxybacillus sp. KU2-6(11)]PIC04682.1 alpha-amylase/pullulanase [Anoxybacillus flavithermus]
MRKALYTLLAMLLIFSSFAPSIAVYAQEEKKTIQIELPEGYKAVWKADGWLVGYKEGDTYYSSWEWLDGERDQANLVIPVDKLKPDLTYELSFSIDMKNEQNEYAVYADTRKLTYEQLKALLDGETLSLPTDLVPIQVTGEGSPITKEASAEYYLSTKHGDFAVYAYDAKRKVFVRPQKMTVSYRGFDDENNGYVVYKQFEVNGEHRVLSFEDAFHNVSEIEIEGDKKLDSFVFMREKQSSAVYVDSNGEAISHVYVTSDQYKHAVFNVVDNEGYVYELLPIDLDFTTSRTLSVAGQPVLESTDVSYWKDSSNGTSISLKTDMRQGDFKLRSIQQKTNGVYKNIEPSIRIVNEQWQEIEFEKKYVVVDYAHIRVPNLPNGTYVAYYDLQLPDGENIYWKKQFTVSDGTTQPVPEKEVHIQTDQAIYSPNSEVKLNGYVRKKGQAGYGMKPTLKVTSPTNDVVYTYQWNDADIQTDGSITTSFTLNQAVTGVYQVELVTGTGERAYTSFTVSENAAPVIVSPQDGSFVRGDNNKIYIHGYAKANIDLTVQAKQGEEVITSVKTKSDATGRFSVELELADGTYSLVLSDGEQSSKPVTITVDTTPPAKPEVTIKEENNELVVSWNEDKDVAYYNVLLQVNGGEWQTLQSGLNSQQYRYSPLLPNTTYRFKVVAVDQIGNSSEAVAEWKTEEFAATTLKVHTEQGYLKLDANIDIELYGSYKEGYKATAVIYYDGEQKEIDLTYDTERKAYIGAFPIEQGMKFVDKVVAFITDGKGQKTNELTEKVGKYVGATVEGTVRANGELLTKGKVQIGAYTTSIQSDGTFKLEGLPEGFYSIDIHEGKEWNYAVSTIQLQYGQKEQVTIHLPQEVRIHFVDQNGQAVTDRLYVEMYNDRAWFSGYINQKGQFVSWDDRALKRVPAGEYKLIVYGNGLYETLKTKVTIDPKHNYVKDPIEFTLNKKDIEVVDVKLTFKDKHGNVITEPNAYFYLYQYDVYRTSNYELGFYHSTYPVEYNEDGSVTIPNVVVADGYLLYTSVPGYIAKEQKVDITKDQHDMTITLDRALTVTGKIADYDKMTNVWMYAYTDSSYGYVSFAEDGTFTIKGLSANEKITYVVSATDYVEKRETVAGASEGDTLDLGTITLEKAKYIDGRVYEGSKPLKHVYVYVYDKDGQYAGWARTDKDGYFKVRGLQPGTYKLEAWYNGKTIKQEVDVQQSQTVTLTFTKGTGSFVGEGNRFVASADTIVPGKTIDYKLTYRNNGTADEENVPVTLTLPNHVELVSNSLVVNGQQATLTDGKVTIPKVKAGESGSITFQVKVKDNADDFVRVVAKVGNGDELSATTNVLFVTMQAPAQTSEKQIKVYGKAKPNAVVEVYADGKKLTETKVEGRWWFATVTLPVTKEKESFQLYAVVKENGQQHMSDVSTVQYDASVPKVEKAEVFAGWNGTVSLNPYTGVASFAVVEKTPLDTKIVFSDEVDEAWIEFLGEQYKMEKESDGKTFTFDGSKLGAWSSYGEQMLQLIFKAKGQEIRLPLMQIIVLIDPSGYVFEGSMENRLEGVTAEVQQLQGDEWVKWNAEFYGQVNPQVTDENGRYGWDVISGKWRVVFSKEGYETYISRIVDVPPAETQLNVPLVRQSNPRVEVATPATNAENVDTNANIQVTFDRLMDKSSIEQGVSVYEVKNGQKTKVSGTFTYERMFNGYKSDESKKDHSLLDGKGESGWFIEDETKKLVQSFTFKPNTSFKYGTTYEVVIDSHVKDYAGKAMTNYTYTFTTKQQPASSTPTPGGSSGSGSGGATNPTPTPSTGVGKEVIVNGEKTVELSTERVLEMAKNVATVNIAVERKQGEQNVHTLSVQLPKQLAEALLANGKSMSVEMDGVNIALSKEVLKSFTKADVKLSVNVKEMKQETEGKVLAPVYELSAKTVDGQHVVSEKPVTVAFHVTSTPVDARKAAVYRFNGQSYEYVGGVYSQSKKQFVVSLDAFGTFVVVEQNKTFNDVTSRLAWAKEEIEVLASRTIIQGMTKDRFAPNESITRAQFAVLLARALKLPVSSYSGVFVDVPATLSWAAPYIEAAYRAGIVQGSNDLFKPDAAITREQMATMLVRALAYKNENIKGNESITFADELEIAPYAREHVRLAASLQLIRGTVVNGKLVFKPKANATRAESAVMLYRLLQQLGEF